MFKLIKLIGKYALLFLFSLMTCSTTFLSAGEVNTSQNSAFRSTIKQMQILRKKDINKAIIQLEQLQNSLAQRSVKEKVEFYSLYSELLSKLGLFKKAKQQSALGLNLASRHNISNANVIELYFSQGFAKESLGDIAEAVNDYRLGLAMAQQLNLQKLEVIGLTNLGASYYLREQFEEALITLSNALKLAEQLDETTLMGLATSELGNFYNYIKDEEKSLVYSLKCKEYFQQAQEYEDALNCMTNVGISYLNLKKYQQAITTYYQAEQLLEKVPYSTLAQDIYVDLAIALLKQKNSEPQQAYHYLMLAEQLIVNTDQYEDKIIFLISKAEILFGLKKYQQTLDTFEQAKTLLIDHSGSHQRYFNKAILATEILVYAAIGNYQKAYLLQDNYTDLVYEIQQNDEQNDIKDMRFSYEKEQAILAQKVLTEKQNWQEQKLSLLAKQKNNQRFGVIVGLCVLLFFGVWLFYLSKVKQKLLRVTHTDELTGIANRRHLNELGFYLFKQAKLHHVSFSLLMIDVDRFKAINDQLGHSTGDTVLKTISEIGHNIMRPNDTIARFGGEEFICLLADTTNEQAVEIANRLKLNIERYHWQNIASLAKPVTVSIGVATFNKQDHSSFDDLLIVADSFMYQAKNEGRNRVCF